MRRRPHSGHSLPPSPRPLTLTFAHIAASRPLVGPCVDRCRGDTDQRQYTTPCSFTTTVVPSCHRAIVPSIMVFRAMKAPFYHVISSARHIASPPHRERSSAHPRQPVNQSTSQPVNEARGNESLDAYKTGMVRELYFLRQRSVRDVMDCFEELRSRWMREGACGGKCRML